MIKSKNIKILTSILVITSIFCTVFYSHAESFGRYGINTDDNTEDIINFIKEEINKLQKKHTNIFLVGDHINNIMEFSDLEKDYKDISIEDKLKYNDDIPKEMKIPKELFVKYEHDPNVFDNPVPKNSRDNGKFNLISSIEDPFIINKAEPNMRGQWTLSIKASDDTKNPNWDKYADEKSISFIIHEKPKAIIEYWKEETDFEVYLTSENSYDIDYQYSKANNGIVKYVWKYQTKDGTWHEWSEGKFTAIPKIIGGQKITNYALTVYDCYNAKDTVLASIQPPKLVPIVPEINANLYPEISEFMINNNIVIPSTESLKVLDIFTRSINFVGNIHFSLYTVQDRRSPLAILSNPADVISTDGIETYWRDIRNYKIPARDINNQYLRDGYYIAKIKGIDGTEDLEKEWTIQIKTPINLKTNVPKKFQAETSVTIKATTTKYVESLTIKLYKGTPYEKVIKNPTVTSKMVGENIEWQYIYEVPNNIPDGEYIIEFTAVTYNGETETNEDTFIHENLKLENLRITNIVNHPQHEGKYPILYTQALVDYKAGYCVTFKIDAKGNPDTVKMRISYPGYSEEFDMVMESQNGSDSVWKLEWYADPFVKKGTIINTKVIAYKEDVRFNFNNEYSWDGDYLIVIGSIENDVRVDQEF